MALTFSNFDIRIESLSHRILSIGKKKISLRSSLSIHLTLPNPLTKPWCLFNTSRNDDSTTTVGSLLQCWVTLLMKNFILNIQSKSYLVQPELIVSCPITYYVGEDTNTQWHCNHPYCWVNFLGRKGDIIHCGFLIFPSFERSAFQFKLEINAWVLEVGCDSLVRNYMVCENLKFLRAGNCKRMQSFATTYLNTVRCLTYPEWQTFWMQTDWVYPISKGAH